VCSSFKQFDSKKTVPSAWRASDGTEQNVLRCHDDAGALPRREGVGVWGEGGHLKGTVKYLLKLITTLKQLDHRRFAGEPLLMEGVWVGGVEKRECVCERDKRCEGHPATLVFAGGTHSPHDL
jgi:hypothetical protein